MVKILNLKKAGFTMVELLIVLVIVAILAAVAAPIYSANTKRAIASDAVAAMSLIRQAEREYSLRNNGAFLAVADEALYGSGLSIDLRTAQYFSNQAFMVYYGSGSGTTLPTTFRANSTTAIASSILPTAPQDFLIRANGKNSVVCLAAGSPEGCAVNYLKAEEMCLEMDNTGRVYVSYADKDCATSATNWEVY